MTYGYITKHNRIRLGLPKEYYNDAFCIAGNFGAEPLDDYTYKKKVRRHNRQIHKFKIEKGGKKKANQAKHVVNHFRLFDTVRMIDGTIAYISGLRTAGSFTKYCRCGSPLPYRGWVVD